MIETAAAVKAAENRTAVQVPFKNEVEGIRDNKKEVFPLENMVGLYLCPYKTPF